MHNIVLGGLEACIKSKTPFTCCARWLPLTLIAQHCIFPTHTLTSYTSHLSELTAEFPLYCSSRRCAKFLASRTSLARGIDTLTCPRCNQRTCVHCRRGAHTGVCKDDSTTREFFDKLIATGDLKLCPKCQQLVEKNGGCKNMTCRCGIEWCWKCGRERRRDEMKGCVCAVY
jgi:IBR domain, a half RING-finger domain